MSHPKGHPGCHCTGEFLVLLRPADGPASGRFPPGLHVLSWRLQAVSLQAQTGGDCRRSGMSRGYPHVGATLDQAGLKTSLSNAWQAHRTWARPAVSRSIEMAETVVAARPPEQKAPPAGHPMVGWVNSSDLAGRTVAGVPAVAEPTLAGACSSGHRARRSRIGRARRVLLPAGRPVSSPAGIAGSSCCRRMNGPKEMNF